MDQAFEFALPNEEGTKKLIRLYAGQIPVTKEIESLIVRKTSNASAAFIKELMRRAAQAILRAGSQDKLTLSHVESALEEMLFAGGSLNRKLLGGAGKAAR